MNRMRVTPVYVLMVWALACPIFAESNAERSDGPGSRAELKQVILYSAGLGAFQYEVELEAEDTLKLPFSTANVNDVLRTITVHDPDSKLDFIRVEAPGQRPQESLLNITSRLDLLMDLRGEKLAFELLDGTTYKGRLLSIENSLEALNQQMVERVRLTTATSSGLETFLLEDLKRFECLDATVQMQITKAMEALHAEVSEDSTVLELGFSKGKKRVVKFGYLHSMPVWKPSYTLASEELSLRILVDNISKQDWRNIELTIADGQPVSFEIDLRQIARLQRERLALPIGLPGLPPILAESTIDSRAKNLSIVQNAPQQPAYGMRGMGFGGGGSGGVGGGGVGGGMGGMMMGGSGGPAVGGMPEGEMFGTPGDFGLQQRLGLATQSYLARTKDGGGAAFFMKFSDVSIPAGSANLLTSPKLNTQHQEVTVYPQSNQGNHSTTPYLAAKLVNQSNTLLPPGPLSVFASGVFLGDAMLPRLSPGRARFVSFAVDGALRVEPIQDTSETSIASVTFDEEFKRILVKKKIVEARGFTIRNRSDQERTTVIETNYGDPKWLVSLRDKDERQKELLRLHTIVPANKDLVRMVSRSRIQKEELTYHSANLIALNDLANSDEIDQTTSQRILEIINLRREYGRTSIAYKNAEEHVRKAATEVDRLIRINHSGNLTPKTAAKYARQMDEAEDRRKELAKFANDLRQLKDTLEQSLVSPGLNVQPKVSSSKNRPLDDNPFGN